MRVDAQEVARAVEWDGSVITVRMANHWGGDGLADAELQEWAKQLQVCCVSVSVSVCVGDRRGPGVGDGAARG